MRNASQWKPSKFILRGKRLVPSRKHVTRGSVFVATIQGRLIQKLVEDHAKGRLLDLGCGSVPFYAIYKDKISESVCVDWENSPSGTRHLDHVVDLSKPLELDSGYFDTILCTSVIEHLKDPDLIFSEMARLLAPAGKLLLEVPFMYHLHERPHDFHRYTEFRLRDLCESNGLEVLVLEAYGGPLEVIIDVMSKCPFVNVLRFLGRIDVFFKKLVSRSALGERMRTKAGRLFPLGYTLVVGKPR